MSKKYVAVAKDFHSPLVRNEIWVSFCYRWPELFDLPRPEVGIYAEENAITYVLEPQLWSKAKEVFQKRVQENPTHLVEAIARCEAWGAEMNTFTGVLRTQDLSTWSAEQLIDFYDKFVDFQSRQYAVGIVLPLIDIAGVSFLEEFLRSYLEHRLAPQEAAEAFSVFTTPTKNSFALDQEMALLRLAQEFFTTPRVVDILRQYDSRQALEAVAKEFPELLHKLQKHTAEHGWVYYVYAGPAFTEAHFVQFLQDYVQKGLNPEQELAERERERATLLRRREQFFEELQPDATTQQLIEVVSEFVWSKPRRKDYQSKSYWHMETFYREYARRVGISLRHARSAMIAQIKQGLLGEAVVLKTLDEQYRRHFVESTEAEVRVVAGERARELFGATVQAEETVATQAQELKGSTAYPGIVQGVVKVINRPEDMAKMEYGNVLVSVATTPSIVPAMKQAAAIISDEGGLTCHAAIVSRELKTPCVVGTKVATQVLQDGDEVEVDANKGVVKIIKSQSADTSVPVYEKIFARDFSLPLIQAWCRGESSNPRQWTDKQQPKTPYIIFERANDTVNCYMDVVGVTWIKEELKAKMAADTAFLKTVVNTFRDKTKDIQPLWDAEATLDLPLLKDFLRKLEDAWPWFEAIWWLLEVVPSDTDDYALLKEARVATDRIGPGSDAVIRQSLKKAWPKLSDLSSFLLVEEIFSENVPDQSELQKRASGYFYTSNALFSGSSAAKIEKKFGVRFERMVVESSLQELRGQTAYGGVVRGKVRRVMGRGAVPSLQAGEILVSSMTTPDFLPAMQKAAAFVTDEGGVTCHAAIMAREFQKPCIIGTKIATQVLQDGDEVEVDADKGSIRILSTSALFRPEDYIRMFAGHAGFSYLFSDVFLNYYKDLGVLSVQDENLWMSFLPKKFQEQTLADGKKLYSNKKSYREYKESFDTYMQDSSRYFESILSQQGITAADVERFLALASQHFLYYSKTEFFYTDSINQAEMVPSVQEFDQLKLAGRSHLNKIIFEEQGYIKRLLRQLSGQTTVPESHLFAYSCRELVELVASGERMPETVITDRSIFFAAPEQVVVGKAARSLIDAFFTSYREISNTIRGTIAQPGKVRGMARVIPPDFKNFSRMSQAVEEMKHGEILVAETTAPEIIQACKKAAAIITNQGGMLSHAAIVSRELGIPCIIGTDKDVILNIHTGDELDVDADRGIVKIVGRKQRDEQRLVRGSDYKVLFKMKGRLTCLHSDFFVKGSLSLGGAVVVFKQGQWQSFINREKEKLCLQRGLEIFSSEDLYREYADGFREYIRMAHKDIIPRFKKPVLISREELREFLPVLARFWYFYGITEFSYHDVAYEKLLETNDPVLRNNLDDLGKLKFEGRELLNAYIFEGGVLHNLLQGIAENFLENREDGEFLFGSELLDLYDGKVLSHDIIAERRRAYGCMVVDNALRILSYNEALGLWNDLHQEEKQEVITGTVANKGKASGKVVVAPMLVSPTAIAAVAARMNKGDILVAESTTPELMSLVNKAVAIVTDQGGMLSHAAIVSRELGIPCIIGTGTATEVLKDGDTVEVDADRGVVRKI